MTGSQSQLRIPGNNLIGAGFVVVAGFGAIVLMSGHARQPSLWSGALVPLILGSGFCFLYRSFLVVDLSTQELVHSVGIWPFLTHERRQVTDVLKLEVDSVAVNNRVRTTFYRLRLHFQDGTTWRLRKDAMDPRRVKAYGKELAGAIGRPLEHPANARWA